jgi:hypothetical protein
VNAANDSLWRENMSEKETSTPRIEKLAAAFPSLRPAPGASPWDPLRLDAWAATSDPSDGERISAQFILAVWNPDEEWRSGRFDLMEAFAGWDQRHHAAFLGWAIAPWWA